MRRQQIHRSLISVLQQDTCYILSYSQQSPSNSSAVLQGRGLTSTTTGTTPRQIAQQAQNTRLSDRAAQTAAVLAFGLAAGGCLHSNACALVAQPEPSPDAAVQDINSETPAPNAVADVYALPRGSHGVPKEIILFQYDVCPFCCKLKAVLDYYKLPYTCVEVGPLFKSELKWLDKYKKVPVVMLDGEVMVDSSAIISRIAAEEDAAAAAHVEAQAKATSKRGWFGKKAAAPEPSDRRSPQHMLHTEEERKWREWVDKGLVRVLTINIYRSRAESFQTFDYITQQGNFSWAEREFGRVFGAAMMWMISGRLKRKYDITGEPRQELYDTAAQWVTALGDRAFLGGDAPNLADLSTFGAIRSITETDTFMDLMHNTDIGTWYERMMAAVGPTARKNPPSHVLT